MLEARVHDRTQTGPDEGAASGDGAAPAAGQRVARSSRVSITRFEKPHSLSYQATTLM